MDVVPVGGMVVKIMPQSCRCHRCDGSGRVAGNGREERPWSSFEQLPFLVSLEKVLGLAKPRCCPGCGGSGHAADQARH